MEPFEVKILDETFIVHPQENGSYQLFRGDTLFTTLTPRVIKSGVTWEADDFIDSEYVQQIGQMIRKHNTNL